MEWGKISITWAKMGHGPPLKGQDLLGQMVDFSGRAGSGAWPEGIWPEPPPALSSAQWALLVSGVSHLLLFIDLKTEPVWSACNG